MAREAAAATVIQASCSRQTDGFSERPENLGDDGFSERELFLAEEATRARQSASSLAAPQVLKAVD